MSVRLNVKGDMFLTAIMGLALVSNILFRT